MQPDLWPSIVDKVIDLVQTLALAYLWVRYGVDLRRHRNGGESGKG